MQKWEGKVSRTGGKLLLPKTLGKVVNVPDRPRARSKTHGLGSAPTSLRPNSLLLGPNREDEMGNAGFLAGLEWDTDTRAVVFGRHQATCVG